MAAVAVAATSLFLLRDPEHTYEVVMQQFQDKTVGTNNTYRSSEKGMTSSDYEKKLGITHWASNQIISSNIRKAWILISC